MRLKNVPLDVPLVRILVDKIDKGLYLFISHIDEFLLKGQTALVVKAEILLGPTRRMMSWQNSKWR